MRSYLPCIPSCVSATRAHLSVAITVNLVLDFGSDLWVCSEGLRLVDPIGLHFEGSKSSAFSRKSLLAQRKAGGRSGHDSRASAEASRFWSRIRLIGSSPTHGSPSEVSWDRCECSRESTSHSLLGRSFVTCGGLMQTTLIV